MVELAESPLRVRRLPLRLTCDARRTIMRFFWPGTDVRARRIIDRVMGLGAGQVGSLLKGITEQFSERHPAFGAVLMDHYQDVARRIDIRGRPGPARRLLIGAYFTMEYAFESAALFNPSMVPARHQDGVAPGAMRFLMSLRALGEGHISSIVFRTGTIGPDCEVTIDPVSRYSRAVRRVEDRDYDRHTFELKLTEMGAYNLIAGAVLERLDDRFTLRQFIGAIGRARPRAADFERFQETADSMVWLARSNYKLTWGDGTGLEEMVLFPVSETESQGMEDMRLVRFVDPDGSLRYYGTYTAFNGRQILPQILESAGEHAALSHTLNGRYARGKGMALFPRKIGRWYVMVGRPDGENLYLLRSTNIRFWNDADLIQGPKYPWEFIQIGNCGSPIETEAGWLLLTHGVGPMRRYCMGASLLDLHDPTRVIGRLREPLLMPLAEERSGYVPNVVYSCGSVVHRGMLVIPYGISDAATGFAVVPLRHVLARMGP